MSLGEVASLWIGPQLSWLEQLCLKSFVDAGHRTTLFTYDAVAGVPEGVHLAPASDFLPATEFIRHARTGSPAYHADVFRLRMIRDSDLCWVDTDAYCVKPFEIPDHGHWHGWISDDVAQINNGVLKLPKDSATLAAMLDFTSDEYPIPPWLPPAKQDELRAAKARGEGVHVSLLPWGVWGPNALTHFLHATGEVRFSQEKDVLYPVPFSHKQALLKPGRRHLVEGWVTENTASIHFWGRRFRSAASRSGGIPEPGSYTADLLAKHRVDPRPTAHLMRPAAPPQVARIAPESLDFSMFTADDLVNLMMQRSSTVETPGAVQAWTEGDEAPLRAEAEARREAILHGAWDEIQAVFAEIHPRLAKLAPARVADIGAGYAFVDLMLHRAFGCDLVLIDIEESANRHFGFEEAGAGYSSLATARAFLVANGVPETAITTINPRKDEGMAQAGRVDLALSLISCGFHYPAETYDAFYAANVAPTGAILLDIRKGSGGLGYLKKFGHTSVLRREKKLATVFVNKGVA
ncbi:MAG: class I SAM-dependent methyltransferase [Alphaproteobacteria bacterium HGW-Alphaproteobacteria-2]|nr:MAG: class I SAM-dependent methyltransferase [Alphaproteobacteria bacterium HGW-Alphaproteobacteria-2]